MRVKPQITTAVVLCGGLGTRLRSVLPDQPKTLAPVNGKPFICFLLDQIIAGGCSRIVLSAGYKADQLQTALGREYRSVPLVYSVEDKPLGTGGALRRTLPSLDQFPVLVLNGDSYTDLKLDEYLRWHMAQDIAASMVLTEVPDIERFGSVQVSGSRIVSFEEKGFSNVAKPSNLINAGIYLLSRYHIETIPADTVVSLERQCFPNWILTGFYAFTTVARFIDIGTPDSYSSVSSFFRTHETETISIS